jgi:hypothetical protein
MRLLVDGKELDFDPAKLLNVEAIAITKATKIPFADFGEHLTAMDFELITAIVWVLRKRTEPELRISDVVFPVGSCEFVDDEADGPKDPTPESETTPSTDPSSLNSSDSDPGTSTD